jgi:membrane-bound lytic murein transglycosylase B
MKKFGTFLLPTLLLCPLLSFAGQEELTSAQKDFAHQLATQDHFSEKQVQNWLIKSKPDSAVIFKTNHPSEDGSWDRYRRLFVTDRNAQGGVTYYHKHKKTLQKAYRKYGVDPIAIVSIIGIESYFGKHQGTHNAATALNTLAFFSERRQHMFQKQLRSLFLLSRQLHIDPLSLKSSYSGALGQPQFMPSTYLGYAVSPQGKAPNLFSKADDVIFSTAHYLAKMGWKKDQPIATASKEGGKNSVRYQQNGKDRTWEKAANFRVIHRYNQSDKYTLAVSELANKIRSQL